MYEAEIARMKKKIDNFKGVDNLIEKEETLTNIRGEIRQKK